MEIDPLMVKQYFDIFTLSCAALIVGSTIRSFFKYLIILVLVLIFITIVIFFGGNDMNNISVGSAWGNIGDILSITFDYMLDILKKAGIVLIIPFVIGWFTVLRKR